MTVVAALGHERVSSRRVYRPALVAGLVLALSPRVALADEIPPPEGVDEAPSLPPPAAPAPSPPPPRPPHDEVWLRDGRRIEGRIVERAPGRWVVIETDDGYRRMFPWDTVVEVATAVAPPPVAASPGTVRDTWRGRSGGGATYELRAMVATLAMPDRTFHLTGTCSTGSGNAPVSMYGQSASDGAVGFGGGVGGRFGWTYRTEMHADSATSWWAFRAGSGLDVLVYSVHTPIGLPAVNGGLCSEVSKATYDLKYESSSTFAMQVPLNVGGHVAFGKLDDARWSGIVLGLAYTPTFVHATPFTTTSSSHLNPLGLELTVDFAVMHASQRERAPEPQVRAAIFFAPHTFDSQPAIGTLSIGAVWF